MRFLLLIPLLLGFVPVLSATVLIPAEFREIVSGSQIIVHGRVSEIRPEWIDGSRRIESVITVYASSFYRGTSSSRVTFRVPGGQIGRYKSVTVGAPEFKAGEEVVLFLKSQGPAVPYVFGLNQGVFRVARAPDGTAVVTPPARAASAAGTERVVRGDPARRPVAVPAFAREVRMRLEVTP